MIIKNTKNLKNSLYQELLKFSDKKTNIFISGGSILNLFDNQEIKNIKTKNWNIYFVDERVTENEGDWNCWKAKNTFFKYFEGSVHPLIPEYDLKCNEKLEDKENIKKIEKCDNDILENSSDFLIDENILKKYTKIFESETIHAAFIGMGDDGHIASIFPSHQDFLSNNFLLKIKDAPFIPKRITISVRAFNLIKNVFIFHSKKVKMPFEKLRKYLKSEVVIYTDQF